MERIGAERSDGSPEFRTTIERRKSPRAPVVVRVAYFTVDSLFSEFATNINRGGMFVETESPPPIDSLISLRFQLPGSSEPIKVKGRVVRVSSGEGGEPAGMGIQFEDLDRTARERINELVLSLRADRPQRDQAG